MKLLKRHKIVLGGLIGVALLYIPCGDPVLIVDSPNGQYEAQLRSTSFFKSLFIRPQVTGTLTNKKLHTTTKLFEDNISYNFENWDIPFAILWKSDGSVLTCVTHNSCMKYQFGARFFQISPNGVTRYIPEPSWDWVLSMNQEKIAHTKGEKQNILKDFDQYLMFMSGETLKRVNSSQ